MQMYITKLNFATFIYFLTTIFSGLAQERLVNNGAYIKINKNTTMKLQNSDLQTNGGVLKVSGNLYLGGDIINNTKELLEKTDSGYIEINGSTPQIVTGVYPTVFDEISINSTSQIFLWQDFTVTKKVKMQKGNIVLGSYDLILNDNNTLQMDNELSVQNMVVTDGSGAMKYKIQNKGVYYFPIGDMTGIPEISPAYLNYTTDVIYNPNYYVSLQVYNEIHANNTSKNVYLNRYWSVNQKGIQSGNIDYEFNFLPTDVVGNGQLYSGVFYNNKWNYLDVVTGNSIRGKFVYGSIVDSSLFIHQFSGGDKDVMSEIMFKKDESFKIYSNNKTVFVLLNSNALYSDYSVMVYNIMGQLILTLPQMNSNFEEIEINEKPGIYFVKLNQKNSTLTTKKVFIN